MIRAALLLLMLACVASAGRKKNMKKFQVKLDQHQLEIDELQAAIQDNNAKIQEQAETIRSRGSVTVVTRWGRPDCPANFELMYSGYAGGSNSNHYGSAAEYICLPPDPDFGYNVTGTFYGGYVYGAEYEDSAVKRGEARPHQDVPCAMCVGRYSASLMIPSSTQCTDGWTKVYQGMLATGNHTDHAAAQYICVDQNPQSLEGGSDVQEPGKRMLGVTARCGSLQCPPYKEGMLLTCVVCTK